MRTNNAKEFEENLEKEIGSLNEQIQRIQDKITNLRNHTGTVKQDMRLSASEMEQWIKKSTEEEKKHKARYKRVKLIEKSESVRKFEYMINQRMKRERQYT